MRRIRVWMAGIVLAVLPMSVVTSTVAAPTNGPHGHNQLTLSSSVAGGIQAAEFSDPVTFVFSERNWTHQTLAEDIVLTELAGADLTASICVLPSGNAIHPDVLVGAPRTRAGAADIAIISSCEPGELTRGDAASFVLTTTVGNGSADISARACLVNESDGSVGPCQTVSVNRL